MSVAKVKYFSLVLLVIWVLLSLSSCSSPCKKYLGKWPLVRPETLVKVPKPIPAIQRRAYDLCLLQTHDVQVIQLGQTWRFILPSDTLFENETAEIRDDYKPILNIIADFMCTYSKISVEVAGYANHSADDVMTKFGSLADQRTERQAVSVEKYLVKRGINSRLIYAVGRGNHKAIAWNGSEAGRRLNRRVEISFRYYRDNTAWY